MQRKSCETGKSLHDWLTITSSCCEKFKTCSLKMLQLSSQRNIWINPRMYAENLKISASLHFTIQRYDIFLLLLKEEI